MFYGRHSEIKKLESMYAGNNFEMAIIYGRRRVGKTTLISEFCKDKRAIFFSALESNTTANLEAFSGAIFSLTMTGVTGMPVFKSFDEAFTYIESIINNKERLILVIDEYPYLANAEKSISSILQNYIDHRFKNTKLFIILCGSSMSFMENQVLGYKSPLYGRRTAQFKILPFDYYDTARWIPDYTPEEKAVVYGITGGIPLYTDQVRTTLSLEENVKEMIFDRNAFLFEEPSNLLKQELREPQTYNAIISAIATGSSRLNEIATKVGIESGLCSNYLSGLISLGIVKKESPLIEKSSKKSVYLVADNLFSFWYRFVPSSMAAIMSGRIADSYKTAVAPYISDYMGIIFEQMCKEYLLYHCNGLPIDIGEIGQWWGTDPKEKRQVQIDIVVTSPDKKSAILGECKYRNELMGTDILDQLLYEAELIHSIEKKYYYLFSKSGFTQGLKSRAKSLGIRLISLEDMYR